MNTILARTALLGVLAALPVGLTSEAWAQATATARMIDIPPGPLGAAVARLGRELDLIVTVDPALVRGARTAGIRGSYTPAAAMDALLLGTGLAAREDGRGGYRLMPAAPATPAASQTAGTTTDAALNEVVIVGALTRAEVDAEQIRLRQAMDLTDVFRGIPSVAVGGSVGVAQKIYVRGLEDSMLNVTVDGAPQHGTLFHHIGRVTIEPELLKTVDVQTGAGEATAGFGAIGGAIRFRTRDAAEFLAPDQQFGGMARVGYFSNDGYRLSGTLSGRLAGDLGFLASFVHTDRDDMEDGAGNRLYGTAAEQQLGFLKFGGNITATQRVSVSYEHRDEKASFGQRPNWPALSGDPLFPAAGQRQTAVVNHGIRVTNGLDLESTAYWTRSKFTQDRQDRWGLYGAAIRSQGADLRANLALPAHDTVFGIEYRDDRVQSEYLADAATWQPWAWDPDVGRFVETGDVLGVYAQDHWQLSDALLLSVGGRFDRYKLRQVTYGDSSDSSGFSFNAGMRYQLTSSLTLHASIAEAFRGKEIGDAFTLEQRPGRIALSPTLQPEQVVNREGGLSYAEDGWRASAVYYNMRISDVILDQIGNGPAPQAPVYYENVGRFKADGVELQAGYTTGPYSIDAHFNHYRSTLNGNTIEGYEHIGLGNSVGNNWTATLGYRPTPSWSLEASITHYDSLRNIEVLQRAVEIGWIDGTRFVDKPGYSVVDVFGQWRPMGNDRLSLGVAVYNVFDKLYRSHASVADYTSIPDWEGIVGVNEPGRNVRLNISMSF
jgi:hemoglobin/transferrin/lactoferrin receptor protein